MAICFGGAAVLVASHRWIGETDPMQGAIALPLQDVPTIEPKALFRSASSLQRGFNGAVVIIDLGDRRVALYQFGQLQATYPIAVGQEGWETPMGTFQVEQMRIDPVWRHPITKAIVPAGADNPLGTRWIGFWIDGEYQIGLHGTNEPGLVGSAVSHGCIRMLNPDIEQLFERVGEGTPVVVRQ